MDVTNDTAVKEVVHRVMTNHSLSPHIPHEFTQRGMLERIGTFLRHQNFCDGEDLASGKPGEPLSLFGTSKTSSLYCSYWYIAQLFEGRYVSENFTIVP